MVVQTSGKLSKFLLFFQRVLVASSVFVWRFDRSEYKGNEIIKKTSNSSRLYRLIFGVYCLNGGEINIIREIHTR